MPIEYLTLIYLNLVPFEVVPHIHTIDHEMNTNPRQQTDWRLTIWPQLMTSIPMFVVILLKVIQTTSFASKP